MPSMWGSLYKSALLDQEKLEGSGLKFTVQLLREIKCKTIKIPLVQFAS